MFQVIHARKIKTEAGLINVVAHNCRVKFSPGNIPDWINPDWVPDGLHDTGIDPDTVLKLRQLKLHGLTRKPQKNAAAAIEFSISADSNFDRWKDYFQDALKFLKLKYGADNLLHTSIHTDETTPHMHVIFVPILCSASGERKYSSSNFLGGREGLTQLQTMFYEQVGKKYSLERGIEGSRAKHADAKAFQKQVEELEKQRQRIKVFNAAAAVAREQAKDYGSVESSVILPDFNSPELRAVSTPEILAEKYKKSFGESHAVYAHRVLKSLYSWAQKRVFQYQQKYNSLAKQLFNTSYALAIEKKTTERLQQNLDRYDYRSKTPEELEQIAAALRLKKRPKTREKGRRNEDLGYDR